jgi:hypothetical protein
LSCHTKATGVPLVVREARKEPLTVVEFVAETQKAKFGPRFKQDGKAVQSAIDQLTQDVKEKLSLELKENGKITIDVPGVGDGKVELTSGIESAPHEFPVKIANFWKNLSELNSSHAPSILETMSLVLLNHLLALAASCKASPLTFIAMILTGS